MTVPIWEDFISLNSRAELSSDVLGPARDYTAMDSGEVTWDEAILSKEAMLARDTSVLPILEHREGYYGPNHYNYWASGLRDYCQLLDWARVNDLSPKSLLDIGCATGRFLRHVESDGRIEEKLYGCDINRLHIDWIARHLPPKIFAFQNSSIPTLPLADACVDVVTAFSVFTHVESFDTTWLMEIRRILRSGGIAWITIHGDRTWRDINPTWPLYAALNVHPEYAGYRHSAELPRDRLVFRWFAERSYTANIFYSYSYIRRYWGRLLAVKDIFPALPLYQDIVVLQKE
jgi:SAM-dependent methyltransferase